MDKEITDEENLELEKQLSCPIGQKGIEVGNNMNRTNIGMTLNTIKFLQPGDKNLVLELGHGNCGHLGELLRSAKEIRYYGLEVSETMWREAGKVNGVNCAVFKMYDGESIPYDDSFFDRILSVNCIYFWSDPEKLIKEIERTLKPDGFCVLTYANRDSAKKLPFVRDRFTLYDQPGIERLIGKTNLQLVEIKELTELLKSVSGEEVEMKYHMAKLKRCSK